MALFGWFKKKENVVAKPAVKKAPAKPAVKKAPAKKAAAKPAVKKAPFLSHWPTNKIH